MNSHPLPPAGMLSTKHITGLAISLALLVGCGKARHEQTAGSDLPSAKVRTAVVQSGTVASFEEVVGTIRAKLRASLEAKASGRIVELPVVLGQKLKRGDLLVRLDAPEIKARFEQAEANLQQAEREWKRISSLYNQQAATQADSDAAESRLQLAQAGVSEARAMLDYVEVKAPFDGVVTRKVADIGDLASPGKPLVELEDPARLQLEADVPEAISDKIQPGARMAVRIGKADSELTGTVAEIAPNADPLSRTFRVKLDLPDQHRLMSGQFARLAVPVGEVTSLRVPATAVVQRGQMEMVFAVENQRARLHLVKTGHQLKDETEIISGLDAGDSVVVDNASLLVDGQPVVTQ